MKYLVKYSFSDLTFQYYYAQNNERNRLVQRKHVVVFKKIYNLYIPINYIFFLITIDVFFTSIDFSHYFVYESIKVK